MNYYDVIELAAELINYDLDSLENDNYDELEEEFYAKYEISLDLFARLIEDLIKFTPVIQSPLTKELYHAFVKDFGNGINLALIKERYERVNKD